MSSLNRTGKAEEYRSDRTMQVHLRIRPRLRHEGDEEEALQARDCNSVTVRMNSGLAKFQFHRVYSSQATQADVFQNTVRPLFANFLAGESSLVFAYGVTNSGKSHTIHGTEIDHGILPRTLISLFTILESDLSSPFAMQNEVLINEVGSLEGVERILRLKEQRSAEWKLSVSCIEIYMENIIDCILMREGGGKEQPRLVICDDGSVQGMREVIVENAAQALKLINEVRRTLNLSQTVANHQSSRSHSLFIIHLLEKVNGKTNVVSRLTLCDLAGSERANKTQTTGVQLKEAGVINKSLLTLGRCFETLRQKQNGQNIPIPVRDSKLTRLLQNELLTGRAVMIMNASPCATVIEETTHALNFASIAREIKQQVLAPVVRKRVLEVSTKSDGKQVASLWMASVEELQRSSTFETGAAVRRTQEIYKAAITKISREYRERISHLEQIIAQKGDADVSAFASGELDELKELVQHLTERLRERQDLLDESNRSINQCNDEKQVLQQRYYDKLRENRKLNEEKSECARDLEKERKLKALFESREADKDKEIQRLRMEIERLKQSHSQAPESRAKPKAKAKGKGKGSEPPTPVKNSEDTWKDLASQAQVFKKEAEELTSPRKKRKLNAR